MIQNEGETDRLVRAILGALLLLVGFSVGLGVWQLILYVLGGLMLLTSLTGFCLIYKLFDFTTNKK